MRSKTRRFRCVELFMFSLQCNMQESYSSNARIVQEVMMRRGMIKRRPEEEMHEREKRRREQTRGTLLREM